MKNNISKSILNSRQKKTAMFFFEIILFICAVVFLLPVFLAFLNSFKSNTEIQMNIATLPRFRVTVPDKVEQRYFDGMIINRLSAISDREFFKSFYNLKEAEYHLKSLRSDRMENIARESGIIFNDKYIWSDFNNTVIQSIESSSDKDYIRTKYKYIDGVYILKDKKLNDADKAKLISILKDNNIFRTIKENFVINYSESWKQTKFPQVFMNTFIITLFSTLGIILISSMAAYGMVRTKTRMSWIIFLLFTFAMVVPFQAIMFPLVRTAKSLNLLGTFQGIILIYMGVGCPMAIFMYHGFMKGIPMELEESAALDGAGQFTIFFRVVFPLLSPITATIAILNVLWLWNDFLLPLIITVRKIVTLQLAQYYTRGAFQRDLGMELASLVLAAFPVIVFYLLMQKYIIKGITAGAVKG